MLPNLAGLALRGDGDDGEEEVVPTAVDTKGTGIGKVRLKPLKKRIELPSLKLPDGTEVAPCGSDPECARVVAVRPAVVEAVAKLFANTSPAALAQGRDLRDRTDAPYKSLRVQAVFEIEYGESNASYKAYIARKAAMLAANKPCDSYGAKEECTRTNVALAPAVKDLMQMGSLAEGVNETFLLHGSFPSALLAIMQAGFKTDMSRAGRQAYGAGIYQAEDVGKADQYASSQNSWQLDVALGLKTEDEMRAQMRSGAASTKPTTFYMLVTRTLLGCATHMADDESSRYNSSKRGLNDTLVFEAVTWQDAKGVWHREHRIAPPYDSIIKEHSDTLRGRAQWHPQRFREFLVQKNDQVLPVMIVAYTRDPAPIEPPYDPRTLHCDIWSPVAAALRDGSAEARYRAAWHVKQVLEDVAPRPKAGGLASVLVHNEMYKAGIVEALAKVATERVTSVGWTEEHADLLREKEALGALSILSQWSADRSINKTMAGRHTVRNLLEVYGDAPLELDQWAILDLFAAMLDKLMVRERVTTATAASAAQLLELLSTLVRDHDDATRKAMLLKVGMPRVLRAWAVLQNRWSALSTFIYSYEMITNAIELVGLLLLQDEDALDDAVLDEFLAQKGVQGLVALIKYHSVVYVSALKTMPSPHHNPIAVDALSLLGVLVSEGLSGGSLACSDLQDTLFDPKWTPLVDPRPTETLREALVRIAWDYPSRVRSPTSVETDMAKEAIRVIGWGISMKPLDSAAICGALRMHFLKHVQAIADLKAAERMRWFVENKGVVIALRVLSESREKKHNRGDYNDDYVPQKPRPPPTLMPEWYDASAQALEFLASLFDYSMMLDDTTDTFVMLRRATTHHDVPLTLTVADKRPPSMFIRNLVDLITVRIKKQLRIVPRINHPVLRYAVRLLHHMARESDTLTPGGITWREEVANELALALKAGETISDGLIAYVLHGEGLKDHRLL